MKYGTKIITALLAFSFVLVGSQNMISTLINIKANEIYTELKGDLHTLGGSEMRNRLLENARQVLDTGSPKERDSIESAEKINSDILGVQLYGISLAMEMAPVDKQSKEDLTQYLNDPSKLVGVPPAISLTKMQDKLFQVKMIQAVLAAKEALSRAAEGSRDSVQAIQFKRFIALFEKQLSLQGIAVKKITQHPGYDQLSPVNTPIGIDRYPHGARYRHGR